MADRFLLDTNVLSETRRAHPNPRVMQFLGNADADGLFLSALTLGELRKGVAIRRRSDTAFAERLATWVDGIETSFADRILGIDTAVSRIWGELSAQRQRNPIDTLIAASALAHGLVLATRNISDFQWTGVGLVDPWQP